jgi:cobalamin biosynthetic protein CobC
LAGPWAVGGPAIEIGQRALADLDWQEATKARLAAEVVRLDGMAAQAGWGIVGGTSLFRTYATPDAPEAQRHFAQSHIWTRIFPYSESWIRFGLPGSEGDWARLEAAFADLG